MGKGLDSSIVDSIDYDKIIEFIKEDVKTDFIFAPHYNRIYSKSSQDLIAQVKKDLKSGNYCCKLPHYISVPKNETFSRPGSILNPIDRVVYQLIIETIKEKIEININREHVFSNQLSDNNQFFTPSRTQWQNFQKKLAQLCKDGGFLLKADIANYFERIPQHHLINLLRSTDCKPEAISFLDDFLLSLTGRNSFGIIQGLFPSDVLGNYFLCDIDSFFEMHNYDYVRFVDDYYVRFDSFSEAQRNLLIIEERLRKNGLHLNEAKSGIFTSDHIIKEETYVDGLFNDALEELRSEAIDIAGYGFSVSWDEEPDVNEEEIELNATRKLFDCKKKEVSYSDKIYKFCLPIFRAYDCDYAIESVLSDFPKKPHLSKLYLSYLSRFSMKDSNVTKEIEKLLPDKNMHNDYQMMYLIASLTNSTGISV